MGDLPGPGLESVSPALAGGFLTTAPPGKPPLMGFKQEIDMVCFPFFQKVNLVDVWKTNWRMDPLLEMVK